MKANSPPVVYIKAQEASAEESELVLELTPGVPPDVLKAVQKLHSQV